MASIICIAAMFASSLAGPQTETQAQEQQPNVILVMADDLGWGDVAYNGNKIVRTPHLDAMSREGIRLDRFYAAAPVCSPTRGSCLTGRHPFRYGITWAGETPLNADEITIAEALSEAGYATGHFGKWHVGGLSRTLKQSYFPGEIDPANYSPPWENGFDECFSTESMVPTYNPCYHAGGDFGTDDYRHLQTEPVEPGQRTGGFRWRTCYWTGPGQLVDQWLGGDDSQLIMDRALDFIGRQDKAGKPSLSLIWFHSVHTPLVASNADRAPYAEQSMPAQHWYGATTAMDRQVGRLRKYLKDRGLADNTIVWFCSDNGPSYIHDFNSAGPFRGKKSELFEGGLRVPAIVEWPGTLKGNRSLDAPISTSDFYPTLLRAAGIRLPPNQPMLDGEDVMPLLDGSSQRRRQPIAFQAPVKKENGYDVESVAADTQFARVRQLTDDEQVKSGILRIMNTKQMPLVVWLLAMTASSLVASRDATAGPPEIIQVMDVDGLTVAGKSGIEQQYKYLREPNAVVTKNGTLVVVAGPHHVRGKNDRAHQDVLCRMSNDSGKSWSDITMIADAGMDSIVPTVLVYDEQKDRILFVYNVVFNDPSRAGSEAEPSRQFIIHTDDAGSTWSEPREILKELSGICVFGGGNGFQLMRGRSKGRLLIPGGHRASGFLRGYFYSDDHGETWSFQRIELEGRQEATGCELDDGTIMLNHRQSGYGIAATFSRDGGNTWSKQEQMLPDAWSACNNSALSIGDGKGRQYVVVGAPLGPENAEKYVIEQDAAKLKRGVEDSLQVGRSNGGVFLSRDGGKTWPVGVCVAPGWTFGYNALVELPNGEIGLVFEGSSSGVEWQKAKRDHNTGARLGIYMVKFSLAWLLAQEKAVAGSRTRRSSEELSPEGKQQPARSVATSATSDENRPNVLFISLDDMNDWIGCYGGHPDAKTPNIDRLARRGILFTNAHCVSPICGPSRASVLTGMRPETTGIYHNHGKYIDYVPKAVTFPEHFRANGYLAMAAGKVNHGLGEPDPKLWDENGPDCGVLGTPFIGNELDTLKPGERLVINRGRLKLSLPSNGGLSRIDRPNNTWNSFDWAPLDVSEDEFPDGKIANWGVQQLSGKHEKPLLLAIGFYKPHQPFFAPRKYFEMHDREKVRLPKTIRNDLADVAPPGRYLATKPWTSGTHETVTKHNAWRDAVHAYLATVSFVDALVGEVVAGLDSGPHADNTWIVLWSDHGWSLGEKQHWGKHVPWTECVRVPLIVIPPRGKQPLGFKAGSRCEARVSLMDLYPTLTDICGLPSRKELEGQSLLPLIADAETKWTEAVVSTIGRGTHSVATNRWRYIRYFDSSEELYDLCKDAEEWTNVASRPENNEVKHQLAAHIPQDKRLKRFVRWGRWKCVFPVEGKPMLFDYEGEFGISEQNDVAETHPDTIRAIQSYVEQAGVDDRRVTMPNAVVKENF